MITMSICPRHRDSFGIRWRCKNRFCAVPPSWAPHRARQLRGDRSITLIQLKLIFKMTSTLVLIGSPICRLCRGLLSSQEKQVLQRGMTMKHRLANFLISYHSTPHTVIARTPAELMVKRQLRTRLTLIKPSLGQVVEHMQLKQKFYHDKSQVERSHGVNEPVRVRILDRGFGSQIVKWSSGVVLKADGGWWYLVQAGGSTRRVHADHLIGVLGHKKRSADLVDSLKKGTVL